MRACGRITGSAMSKRNKNTSDMTDVPTGPCANTEAGIQSEPTPPSLRCAPECIEGDTPPPIIVDTRTRWLLWGMRLGSPVTRLGSLILFFLPWVNIRCVDAKGEVTSQISVSGAQLVYGGATDRSVKAEKEIPQPEDPKVKVEIAPDAFKQDLKPKEIVAKCLLAFYGSFLLVVLSFALIRPGVIRALLGTTYSVVVLASLLGGSWILLENPFFPTGPSLILGQLVTKEYTAWYYASYAAIAVTMLIHGSEMWFAWSRCRPSRCT
jgi:hypothetical protein